jgi:hypothetical protein
MWRDVRHGDSPAINVTGCILRDVMATLRIQLGLPGKPFEHSYKRFSSCTTPTYFHTSWEFCNDHAFIIQDNQPLLKLQRTNDQFLMQAFPDSGHSDKELRLLNICRIWDKVITLADITTGDGIHLMPESLERNFVSTHHTARACLATDRTTKRPLLEMMGGCTSQMLRAEIVDSA